MSRKKCGCVCVCAAQAVRAYFPGVSVRVWPCRTCQAVCLLCLVLPGCLFAVPGAAQGAAGYGPWTQIPTALTCPGAGLSLATGELPSPNSLCSHTRPPNCPLWPIVGETPRAPRGRNISVLAKGSARAGGLFMGRMEQRGRFWHCQQKCPDPAASSFLAPCRSQNLLGTSHP